MVINQKSLNNSKNITKIMDFFFDIYIENFLKLLKKIEFIALLRYKGLDL